MNRIIALGVGASGTAVLCLTATLASAEPPVSPAETPAETPARIEERAMELFESGQHHYEHAEYQAAVDAFREAHRLWPSPELLYNLAQAERLSGDCRSALEHYRAFEASGTEAPVDLKEKIAEMERCIAPPATPLEKPSAVASPPPVAAKLEPKRASAPESGGEMFRALGWASLGGAALSAGLGTLFALEANASKSELEEANQRGARWNAHYASLEDSMVRDRNLAIGFFVGAGVLAGTGTWLVLSPPTSSNGDGAAIKVGRRF